MKLSSLFLVIETIIATYKDSDRSWRYKYNWLFKTEMCGRSFGIYGGYNNSVAKVDTLYGFISNMIKLDQEINLQNGGDYKEIVTLFCEELIQKTELVFDVFNK